MAQYGGDEQYVKEGHQQTEEYAHNPLQSTGVGHGHGHGTVTGTTIAAGHGHEQAGKLHRSGSGSSSSSESDGEGGRRKKKGVIEKIKEKLPGGGDEQTKTSSTATVDGGVGHGYEGVEGHEKKGLMEKIKEKLPGGQH